MGLILVNIFNNLVIITIVNLESGGITVHKRSHETAQENREGPLSV